MLAQPYWRSKRFWCFCGWWWRDWFVYKQEPIDNNIEFEEGMHTAEKYWCRRSCEEPWNPEKNELVKRICSKGIPAISEIELAYRYKGDSKIVAITGSNGKSTVTSLTYHMCKTGGFGLCAGGKYRLPLLGRWQKIRRHYMLLISSFQLDDIKISGPMWHCYRISPKII